jgi:putative nucleotidyltransferase with HDIG domain
MGTDTKLDPLGGESGQRMRPLWDVITALAIAIEAKDPYTKHHSAEVSTWSAKMAQQMGLSQAEVEDIKLAGIVHDIGKIHVPEEVLNKPLFLTSTEFDLIKSHAAWGAKILEPLKVPAVERIVRYHHERIDGTGYPEGLAGDQIPLGARIVGVAEAFQCMIRSTRYRRARPVEEALGELRRCRGTQFDPKVVDALIQLIESDSGLPAAESIGSEGYRERLENMVRERTQQLQAALTSIQQPYDESQATYGKMLKALGASMALKDNGTKQHADRVARYCLEIGKALNCTPEQLTQINRGSYLHDIGKIGIPDAILNKPGKLTPEEADVMQTHSRIGYELVCHIPFLAPAAEIVLAHHERFDGTGYPRGLKGNDIPLGARIVAVANAFDVMVTDQPYRIALSCSFDDAVAEIRRCSGTQFDPKVVAAFLDWVQTHGDPRKRV